MRKVLTQGIVLRVVKYGDTSIITSIYTLHFGIQSYMVKGVRVTNKKGGGKANLFQPGNILDLQVTHSESNKMEYIHESNLGYLYQNMYAHVPKYSVSLFIVELLGKTLKAPEPNEDLFYFLKALFVFIDECESRELANIPLYFALHVSHYFGLMPEASLHQTEEPIYFDLQNGLFENHTPLHAHYISGELAEATRLLLCVSKLPDLSSIKINLLQRRELMQAYEKFYQIHFPDFGVLKTLPVLKEVLG